MKANLQGVFYTFRLEELFPAMKLVCRAVRETRVKSDVFFVVREAPERNPELQLLWDGRENVLDKLKRDEGGNTSSG